MVRHSHIFKKGASMETNLRSFLIELGIQEVDSMSLEDVRNNYIITMVGLLKRKEECVQIFFFYA